MAAALVGAVSVAAVGWTPQFSCSSRSSSSSSMSQQPPQPPRQQKQQYSLWDEASLQVALTQEGIDIRGVRTRAELDALAAAVLPHAVSCGRVAPPAHLLGGNGANGGGENGGGNGAGGGGRMRVHPQAQR